MKKTSLLVLVLFLVSSCASKKEIIYFQDADTFSADAQTFEPIIEANDILHISVSSMDEAVVAPFKKNSNLQNINSTSNPGLLGYLVNSEGNIRFPVLGDVAVEGKTRGAVEKELKTKISEFILDVVVDVRIMNFKVTILGGVNNPGVYTIDDERITLPQAIALAGDLSTDGKRDNIMLIREVEGKQKVTRIDLTNSSIFTSEFYFLKQNDVIYVEPSLKGVKKSGFIPDVPALLSLFTVVLTSVILLTR